MKKVNPKQVIEKNPIIESLFMPLYFRAVETQKDNPLTVDQKAVELVNSIDYDFDSVGKKNKAAQFHVSVRTKILDEQVTKFINETKKPVIVNLGSGLDTRSLRVSSHDTAWWYDIDLPEVISFREFFFKDSEKFKSIGKSVLDFSWINDIEEHRTDSLLFIAEGLFMYFNESDIREIFSQVSKNFPNALMLCEVFHSKMLKIHLKNKKNNKDLGFTWGVSNAKELESLNDNITIEDEWNVYEQYKNRQKLILKILVRLLPDFKNMVKIVKLRFNTTN